MNSDVLVHAGLAGQDVLAGRLYSHRRRGTESASFVYDDQYLAHPEAYPLDPALPLVRGTLQTPIGQPLFGAFADSSPDRWGRTLIKRAEQARAKEAGTVPRSMGELDLLLGVRDDLRQGALRFRSGRFRSGRSRSGEHSPFLATEDSGVPLLTDLPVLLDLAARADRDTADYEELRRLVRAGSSLGGARPKAHVRDTDGSIAIAKFPSANADRWNVMAWEKTALDLARDAGVQVPDSQLVRVGERHVLVVNRFDRRDGNERIGYASAMTMLEARDGDQRSYLELAEVLERHSPSATSDLKQLWRRIALSVLISNTDDHLRNHGFLHVHGDAWTLSPAFDINPNPEPGTKFLSTAIDDADTRASVDTLLSVCDHFRLSHEDALDVLGDVTGVTARWRQVAGALGVKPREIEDMKPAFEHLEADRARFLTGAR